MEGIVVQFPDDPWWSLRASDSRAQCNVKGERGAAEQGPAGQDSPGGSEVKALGTTVYGLV